MSSIWLSEPRLTPHAVSMAAAWLWTIDGSRVLWANAAGAAIFGGPAALAARHFDAGQPAAAQILHLAATLPPHQAARLERLRGFGAGIGRALMCSCARIELADGTPAIFIAATERAGPGLPLSERARQVLAGCTEPVAVFGADGTLIEATAAARDKLGGATTLPEVDAAHTERIASDDAIVLMFVAPREPQVPPEPELQREPQAQAEPDTASQVPPQPEPVIAAPSPDLPMPPSPAPPAIGERRHPLRFVWQIDADGRFTLDSEEFIALAGPRTAAAMGQTWDTLTAMLGLDPENSMGRAIATRDTFSGLSVAWPAGGEPLAVELSGLPVFDRERTFRGYRGFGVCRDVARLNELARQPSIPTERTPFETTPIETTPIESTPPVTPVAPPASAPPDDGPTLSPIERRAFQELTLRLTDRLTGTVVADPLSDAGLAGLADVSKSMSISDPFAETAPPTDARSVLDRFPVGVLVHRRNQVLYANRAFLRWTGYDSVDALMAAGGIDSLFVEPDAIAFEQGADNAFAITTNGGERKPAEGRLFLTPWDGDTAFALVVTPPAALPAGEAQDVESRDGQDEREAAALKAAQTEAAELRAILDTATDGVIVLDADLQMLSTNRSLQALFGYDAEALEGQSFIDLLAPESADVAVDYIEAVYANDATSVFNAGREVIGRERHGGLIPLFMTVGRLGERKFCAVFRDITHWKKTEGDLIEARRAAEKQSSAKSDFLAKISHEIRTPLNAIIGFAEVMMEERFGPVGNDRYREYLKDIHTSGGHLISLINDLLDLSKIEAGKLELSFADVAVNDVVAQCVTLMQQQANREHVIIRSALSSRLPPVTADARSLRQIVLNLLSNSIKFTGAGGQVIVSSALTDAGEVVLRVRDSGQGMSENELVTAMEPFRQLATSTRFGSGGTGLGLPLTKALTEANRAEFRITSKVGTGTLVEVTFPAERIAAE